MTETNLQTNSIPQAVFLFKCKVTGKVHAFLRAYHPKCVRGARNGEEEVEERERERERKEKKKRVSKRAQEGGLKRERERYSCQVRSKGG